MSSKTTAIIDQIEKAVSDIPGWSPIDQLFTLFTLTIASAHLDGDVLELGSWCGRSAVALGMAARQSGRTHVHCVDLFPEKSDWFENEDGTFSFRVVLDNREFSAYHEQTVWPEPYRDAILPVYERFPGGTLQAFQTAMKSQDLQDIVTPSRGDLESFANAAPKDLKLRLAFIDGDHSHDAVCQDIETVERFLLPGGWICFDDAFSSYEGVNAAITEKIIKSGHYSHCQQMTRKLFVARRN